MWVYVIKNILFYYAHKLANCEIWGSHSGIDEAASLNGVWRRVDW